MRIDKLLFPTDFSDCAERAFSHAAHLSARYGAELHVLNVERAIPPAGENPLGHVHLQREDEKTWSDAHWSEALDDDIVIIHSLIESDSVVDGILRYAERHEVHLIVMATHGRTGIDHLLSGSVAEDVVRHASCPVITVRCKEGTGWTKSVKRLLVPVDFSETNPLPEALELARAYDAEVDLLHVVEEAALQTIYGVEPLSPGAPLYLERARGALDRLLEGEDIAGLTISTYVRVGNPARRILEVAQERRSDLIVLASHGRTGLGRLLMGSVAEKVIRFADVPVFTLKPAAEQRNRSGEKASVHAPE